nr:MAG TPA: hypothetical protein [Caudoviricetes sp.]
MKKFRYSNILICWVVFQNRSIFLIVYIIYNINEIFEGMVLLVVLSMFYILGIFVLVYII